MVAAFVAVACFAGFARVAEASPISSTSVSCVNGDGVVSLTITNPAADASAEFVVTNPATFVASVIDLGPGASQIVTLRGLSDGSVVVPVRLNGDDASVTTQISCDATACSDGVLSVVTDDSGVQQEACVASAADPATSPQKASLAPSTQRATSTRAVLPTTGADTGGLVLAAVLVGSGSVVSLLSGRRKPAGIHKGFRRRGATP